MVSLKKVNNLNEYYKKLNIGVSLSRMWNTLQSKCEYGSDRSEKGYQQVAKTMAGNIARGLNLNVDLAEILTMCKGSYFPAYGEEGKKIILQYLNEHEFTITDADLARGYIEYDLNQSGNIISPEFDELLQELFNNDDEPTTPEVQVAHVCSQTIKDVKLIEKMSNINKVDLLYKISKDVEHSSIESKKPVQSLKVKEMLKSIPEQTQNMKEYNKRKIYADLDIFIELAGENIIEGIYEYIGTDEIEK